MIRRITLTTGLLALSVLAFAPNVGAAPVPVDQIVPFSGTIDGVCSFSNTTPGVLAKTGTKQAVEGTTGVPGGFGVGTAGATTVNCTSGGSLATSVPTVVSVPSAFAPAVLQSVVSDGTNHTSANSGGNFDTGIWNKPTTPLTLGVGTNVNLKVGMIAGTNATGAVPTGTYEYTVKLTATPN